MNLRSQQSLQPPNFQPPDAWSQAIESMWSSPQWCHVNTIVAVSGGPDSVALIRTLASIRKTYLSTLDAQQVASKTQMLDPGTLIVTHINHGLRGSESDADQHSVERLAGELELPFEAFKSGNSTLTSEADLRRFRYECLRSAASKHVARYVATGHTLDDQVETILFRIFRGTGMRGLTGIPAFRRLSNAVTLVRPLLTVSKQEIEQTLATSQIEFRLDSSNQQSHYARNFLRNDLLPLIRERFPDVDQAIARLGQHAIDLQPVFSSYRHAIHSALETQTPERLAIDCEKLRSFPAPVLCEMLIEVWDRAQWPRGAFNQTKWQKLAELILNPNSSQQVINLPGSVRAERTGDRLTLIRNSP